MQFVSKKRVLLAFPLPAYMNSSYSLLFLDCIMIMVVVEAAVAVAVAEVRSTTAGATDGGYEVCHTESPVAQTDAECSHRGVLRGPDVVGGRSDAPTHRPGSSSVSHSSQ